MKNQEPFFSVIICCFNSEEFIKETIDSVINQTFKDWEIVVVDDGSSDETSKIIHDYISKGVDINYFYQENRGFASKAAGVSTKKQPIVEGNDFVSRMQKLAGIIN